MSLTRVLISKVSYVNNTIELILRPIDRDTLELTGDTRKWYIENVFDHYTITQDFITYSMKDIYSVIFSTESLEDIQSIISDVSTVTEESEGATLVNIVFNELEDTLTYEFRVLRDGILDSVFIEPDPMSFSTVDDWIDSIKDTLNIDILHNSPVLQMELESIDQYNCSSKVTSHDSI